MASPPETTSSHSSSGLPTPPGIPARHADDRHRLMPTPLILGQPLTGLRSSSVDPPEVIAKLLLGLHRSGLSSHHREWSQVVVDEGEHLLVGG